MRRSLALSFTALLSLFAAKAGAEEPAKKLRMSIGFYVNEIRGVDWHSRQFLVDLYWWIRYPKPAADDEQARIEAIELVNVAAGDLKHEIQEKKTIAGPNGEEVYVCFRTIGNFVFSGDFRRYPFDVQRLPIVVEHTVMSADELELVDDVGSYRRSGLPEDHWGLAADLQVPDLEVRSVRREFVIQKYQTDFGDPTAQEAGSRYSRASITLEVGRAFGSYLVKILIPLLIILLLAYLVFFVPAEELEVAAGLSVTSLLSCIAFQLSVASDLPEIGYVVLSDRIFHLCYLLIMLAMAETVYTFNLERKGRAELSEKLERWARVLYPGLFVLGTALLIGHGLSGR